MIPSNKMCINSTHCTLITQQVISLSGHRGKNWPHVMLCVCAKKSISLLIFWSENCFDERSFHFSGRKRKFLFTDHRKRRLVRDAIDFLCRCAPGKKWLLCRHKRPAHRRTSTVCLSGGIPSAASHRWETLHSFQCTVSPTKKPPLFCQGGGDDGDEGDPPKWCIIIALFHQVFFWTKEFFVASASETLVNLWANPKVFFYNLFPF